MLRAAGHDRTSFEKVFFLSNIESEFYVLNLRIKKWLLCCAYNPHKILLKRNTKLSRLYSSIQKHENFMLIRDYNAQVDETNMTSFCEINELRSLINEPTYCKNSLNSSCIDFSQIISTVLRKHLFRKLFVPILVNVSAVMKSHIQKQTPNIIKWRKYIFIKTIYFNKNKFEKQILNKLSKYNKEIFQIDEFKGATKSYFTQYSSVVIILFKRVYVGLRFSSFSVSSVFISNRMFSMKTLTYLLLLSKKVLRNFVLFIKTHQCKKHASTGIWVFQKKIIYEKCKTVTK